MSTRSVVLSFGAALLLLAVTSPASAQDRLTGTWLTADQTSHVAFAPCGAADCGRITWLREPLDQETGKPWRDKLNPDDALRERPLVGLVMISDLKPVGPRQWQGALYNPLDGKTYTGSFEALGPGKLQLKGCALAGLLCQTEVWTSVSP